MAYQFKITIDKTQCSGTLTDFVYLFSGLTDTIPAGFWDHVAQANGSDILFFDTDNSTELNREIVYFDSINEKVEAWVQIPTLASASNKEIWCRYGGSTRSNDTTVWTDKGFGAVYHLNGNATDSVYGNNGGINGATVNTSAVIHSGYDFNGSSDITITSSANIYPEDTSYTMSGWIYLANENQNGGIASIWNDGGGAYNQVTLAISGDDSYLSGSGKKIIYMYRTSVAQQRGAYTDSGYAVGSWLYIVVIADEVSDTIKIYVNGSLANSTIDHSNGIWPSPGTIQPLTLGKTGSLYSTCSIDEFRIIKDVLSSDWIVTEYNNQNAPQTFSSCGDESIYDIGTSASSLSSYSTSSASSLSSASSNADNYDNLLVPIMTDSFNAEMVYNLTNYVIPVSILKSIESVEFIHRDKFFNKRTGFETVKHAIHKTSGNDIFVDINIMFVGNLSRHWMEALWSLACGSNGAGMQLYFYDTLVTNYRYTCRWVNAGDFVENSALLTGASMKLESWEWSAI